MRKYARFGVMMGLAALVLSLVSLTSVAPVPARAAVKSWVGGSGLWSDPSKWSPSGVPTSTDDVFITEEGTYTVTVSGATRSANTITIGAAGNTGIAILLIATVINAPLAKYVPPVLRRTSLPARAAVFGVLVEPAMVLILLLARPLDQAVEVVKVIASPMIVANAAGVAGSSFMMKSLVEEEFL